MRARAAQSEAAANTSLSLSVCKMSPVRAMSSGRSARTAGEQAGVAFPEARAVQIRELHQAEAVKGRGQGGVAQLVARDAEGAARGQGGRREGGQGQRPGQRAAARHCASTSRTYMGRTLGSLVSRTCSSKRGRFLSMLESLPKP